MRARWLQSLHVHPRIICLSRSMGEPCTRSLAYCASIFYRPIYLSRPLLNDENFIANCRGRKGFYGCLPGRVFISIPGTFRIGIGCAQLPPTSACLVRPSSKNLALRLVALPQARARACSSAPSRRRCGLSVVDNFPSGSPGPPLEGTLPIRGQMQSRGDSEDAPLII